MHPPFSSLIKYFFPSIWLMSHFKTSMKGKMGVLLSTMCKYDRHMFGNTCASSALMIGSLCGIYSGYSSRPIPLKRSPHCRNITLDLVLASISPKVEDWTKAFFVVVLMIGSTLGAYSNYLMVPKEEHSPILASFIFGDLGKHLVVGFLGGILPIAKT
jgi:hypothetical protein